MGSMANGINLLSWLTGGCQEDAQESDVQDETIAAEIADDEGNAGQADGSVDALVAADDAQKSEATEDEQPEDDEEIVTDETCEDGECEAETTESAVESEVTDDTESEKKEVADLRTPEEIERDRLLLEEERRNQKRTKKIQAATAELNRSMSGPPEGKTQWQHDIYATSPSKRMETKRQIFEANKKPSDSIAKDSVFERLKRLSEGDTYSENISITHLY